MWMDPYMPRVGWLLFLQMMDLNGGIDAEKGGSGAFEILDSPVNVTWVLTGGGRFYRAKSTGVRFELTQLIIEV